MVCVVLIFVCLFDMKFYLMNCLFGRWVLLSSIVCVLCVFVSVMVVFGLSMVIVVGVSGVLLMVRLLLMRYMLCLLCFVLSVSCLFDVNFVIV